jgi:hypothetical protein
MRNWYSVVAGKVSGISRKVGSASPATTTMTR